MRNTKAKAIRRAAVRIAHQRGVRHKSGWWRWAARWMRRHRVSPREALRLLPAKPPWMERLR